MNDAGWPDSARDALADVLSRPWRDEAGNAICLRCGQTAERTRPSQGFAATPPQCRCEGRLR